MHNQSDTEFARVIEQNKHRIYRLCSIYAVSPLEPQDLFQEVIIQVWKSLPGFEGKSSVNTWIYRIALNVCYRSKQKINTKDRATVRLDSIHFEIAESVPDIGQLEKLQALRECMSSLNDRDKSIVTLHLEDLPHKEIAAITGLTENHIAVKLKRIRKVLLACITQRIR